MSESNFWSTKAGRAAVLAARSQIRLSSFEDEGQAESVWAKYEADLLEQHRERLSRLLSEEQARPTDEEVERAADAAAGRLSEQEASTNGERLIATALVIAVEASG